MKELDTWHLRPAPFAVMIAWRNLTGCLFPALLLKNGGLQGPCFPGNRKSDDILPSSADIHRAPGDAPLRSSTCCLLPSCTTQQFPGHRWNLCSGCGYTYSPQGHGVYNLSIKFAMFSCSTIFPLPWNVGGRKKSNPAECTSEGDELGTMNKKDFERHWAAESLEHLKSQGERVWYLCTPTTAACTCSTWNLTESNSDLLLPFCMSTELQNGPQQGDTREKTLLHLDLQRSSMISRDYPLNRQNSKK